MAESPLKQSQAFEVWLAGIASPNAALPNAAPWLRLSLEAI